MSDAPFLQMRQGLVDRGLLCGETLRLTPAGDEYARAIVDELADAPPAPDPSKPPVRWDMRRVHHTATSVTIDA